MRVFVAGASGVLGRRLIRRFLEKKHTVIGLARDEKGVQSIRNAGSDAVIGNIYDSDSLVTAVGNADVVIHAATLIPANPKKLSDWAINDRLRREGTSALTQAAAKLGAKTYIQQSVVWVARPADDSYFDESTKPERPDELYRSAFDGEQIASEAGAKFGFNTVVLRCGGFYASDAVHTRMIAKGLLSRRLPLIGTGHAVSANIHIEDAASAYVAVAEAEKPGLWHVTDDDPMTIRDMLLAFTDRLKAPAPWRIPLWLARIFAWKGVIEYFTRSTRTSNRLFKEKIGWAPRFPSFQSGLEEVIRTWKTEGFTNRGKSE